MVLFAKQSTTVVRKEERSKVKMSRATKFIVLVACSFLIVVISAVAIAQGFPPQSAPGQNAPVGFPGPGYGMPMMPPAPAQPVMQVHGDYLFILMGNVLYKIDTNSLAQVGALRLAPPPGGGPFGGPGVQPPNQPQ